MFAGRVKIESHLPCRTSAILKYFCPLSSQSSNFIIHITSLCRWKTVWLQISWHHQKPADLDLHCFQKRVWYFEKKNTIHLLSQIWSNKTCLKLPLKKKTKMVFQTDYGLMQVKSIAEMLHWENSAILSTFIKLPFVINTFVLSIFEFK